MEGSPGNQSLSLTHSCFVGKHFHRVNLHLDNGYTEKLAYITVGNVQNDFALQTPWSDLFAWGLLLRSSCRKCWVCYTTSFLKRAICHTQFCFLTAKGETFFLGIPSFCESDLFTVGQSHLLFNCLKYNKETNIVFIWLKTTKELKELGNSTTCCCLLALWVKRYIMVTFHDMLISNKIEAHLCGTQAVHGEISQTISILKIFLPLTQNNLLTDHLTILIQVFRI